ncbi:carbohydrate binding/glycoside hydrolase [Proteus phage vB_PmiP_RS51pmB]|nr:carbohydrate binding/glycoside hydrolase [Proteus phage vB_PmiP_RS51pmB]
MSVQNKPDYKIFADGAKPGEVVTFPDVLRGWGVTLDTTGGIPPMEFANAVAKRLNEWLMYLTQRGIPEWDAAVDYPKNAFVQSGDVLYVSIKASKGENPSSSQNAWSTFSKLFKIDDKYDKTGGTVSGQVDIASPGGRSLTLKPIGERETSVYLEGYLNSALKWWLGMTGGDTVTLENTATSRRMKITDKFNVNGQLDVESNGGRVNTLKATAGGSVYQELYLQAALAAWWGITNGNKLSIANVATGNTLTIGADGFRIDGKVIGKDENIIGIGQTYKDVTATRKNGVTYTNNSTKPIIIYVESNRTAASESDAYSIGGEVNGVRVAYRWTTANETMSISFIVPPGASFMFKGGWGQSHSWEPVTKVIELS